MFGPTHERKKTPSVTRVKEESNMSFRSCSTAREEEKLLSPPFCSCSIIPAAWLLSSDNTNPPLPPRHWKALYDLFSQREESRDYGTIARVVGSDGERSSGLQVSPHVCTGLASSSPPLSFSLSVSLILLLVFNLGNILSLICFACSRHDPAWCDRTT